MKRGEGGSSYPSTINTRPLQAIYDNLPAESWAGQAVEPESETAARKKAALDVDREVRQERMAGWRGHPIKEKRIARAIRSALGPLKAYTHKIFEIVKAQHEY